ncbi:hypothetical protein [Streptomyces sp. NBC_01264]|uniref:hypothetical protein n=1 Tax=Streptomyces sp. NBC_01264 TaxID=2903804 RepID=UPI002251B2E5|nr:hypothetical protein [Streptomyces sp. NBC_01264]MCX4781699.1 hypothetical protein [Streptomyces sp. NBC_01264]
METRQAMCAPSPEFWRRFMEVAVVLREEAGGQPGADRALDGLMESIGYCIQGGHSAHVDGGRLKGLVVQAHARVSQSAPAMPDPTSSWVSYNDFMAEIARWTPADWNLDLIDRRRHPFRGQLTL